MKFISIVLPTHFSKNNITDWCESIFSSLSEEIINLIEIVQVESYPGDGSSGIVKDYCLRLSIDYKLIIQHPKGAYKAQEQGKLNANGEWLVIVNSDDRMNGHSMKNIIIFLKEKVKKSSNVVFFPVFYESFGKKIGSYQKLNKLYDLDVIGSTHSVGMFIRKKTWEELGAKYSNHKYCADYDLYMRLLKENQNIEYANNFEPIGTFFTGGVSSIYKSQFKIYLEKISILYKYGGKKAVLRNIFYYLNKFMKLFQSNNNKRIAIHIGRKRIVDNISNKLLFKTIYESFNLNSLFITNIEFKDKISPINHITNIIKILRSKYLIIYSRSNLFSIILLIILKHIFRKKIFINQTWSSNILFNKYIKFINHLMKNNKPYTTDIVKSKTDFLYLLNESPIPNNLRKDNRDDLFKDIPNLIFLN